MAQHDLRLKREYKELKSKYTVLGDVRFSGVVRMTSYYRNMSLAYNDLATSTKNLSFSPYPVDLAEAVGGANRGQPFLELVLEGNPLPNSYYKIGYSFNHSFLGLGQDSSRQSGIRQFLKFEANSTTKIGRIDLVAGGGANWISMSPLTLSRKEFRIEPFEKIPWDWYRDSPKKYNDYYSKSSIRTDERFGQAATQGFSLRFSELPQRFSYMIFYGKTSRNTGSSIPFLPFNTFASRLDRQFGKNAIFGVNYYQQFGKTDRVNDIKDARQIITGDFKLASEDIFFRAEIGQGGIINPFTNQEWDWGTAINVNARISRAITKIPIAIQFYDIHKNVVSQESSGFNTNLKAPSGGVSRTLEFDGNMYVNILQEVGMVSNNRIGGVLRLNEELGKFKIEVGNALSVEKENLYDTITIQHRVNSFSRSRFVPFGSKSGPYQRVRNRFMRSFETLGVTDSISDYKKGFNSLDVTMKYQLDLGKRSLILVNYNSLGSVGEGAQLIPQFSDDAFYRTAYEEISAYFLLNQKVVLLAFAGYERVVGNNRTIVSPENGRPVNQTGTGFGVGVDWDFMQNGGIYLRHKWFNHEDANFVLDQFKGQETSVEVKIFF